MIRNIIKICALLLIFYKPLVYAAEYDEYDSVSNINTEKKQYFRTVSGTVKDSEGNLMPGVTVQMEGSDYGTITEGNGFYKISIPDGKVVLVYSFIGFTSHKEEFSDDDRQSFIRDITLKESAYKLEEVTVTGKGREQIKRESPAAITIIDASELKGRTASLEKILNHASGVQVMNSGGFGSTSRVLVQGMDGKRISIFVNGMPMGSSEEFSLSSIPTDYIQNVEIYKGTIPAWLGGDGLGGAINIITKEFNSNHLEVSYQISSYNTHQGNFITSTAFPKSGIAVKLNGTFDYSDNDYDFNSPFEPGRVIHRDHDVYRNLNINAGISFSRLWFDNLDLSFAYGNNYDQVQGGLMNIQNNIQHAFSRSNSFQAMQSLAKKTRNGKWSFSLNSMIDYTIGNVVDTSYYCYDFAGNKFSSASGRGEVGTLPNDSRDIYLSVRELLNINYRINHNHILNWNTSYKYSSKTPHDELADEYASYPVSGYPNRLHSLVSGLNYELKLFDGKLKNEMGLKLFYLNSEVIPPAEVAVIDVATDKVLKTVKDERVNSIGMLGNTTPVIDEEGNIYFNSGPRSVMLGYKEGILRIKKGEDEFDKDFHISLQNIEGGEPGSYAMQMSYGGNGKIYFFLYKPSLITDPNDETMLVNKNYLPYELDVNSKTGKILPLPGSCGWAASATIKDGNSIYFAEQTNSGIGFYKYDMTSGKGSQAPIVTTPAGAFNVISLAD